MWIAKLGEVYDKLLTMDSHSILKYINRRPQSRKSQGFVPKVYFKTERSYYSLLL